MKKVTVTVAISAYKEAGNIKKFLVSVLMQKEKGFILKEIWVHSDGSTDKTVKLARSLKSKKIKVWDHKKRVGKSTWLNKIYKDLQTDFLVQSDADVVFAHELVIHNLIQPLIKSKKVGMCGGNPVPVSGQTFIESCINLSFESYSKFRSEVRGGNNKFSVDGRILAYKKELVKKISVPADMIANDLYTYLCCLTEGYKYKFVKNAVVYFRSPTNLKDHLRQNTRFESAAIRMRKHFKAELVNKETYIPRKILLKHLAFSFLKKPHMALFILFLNQYCRLLALKREKKLNSVWDIAVSTKRTILSSLLLLTTL